MSWFDAINEYLAENDFQQLKKKQLELNVTKEDGPNEGVTPKAAINGTKRTPWFMTTTEWLKTGKGLLWEANPSDVNWSMTQRSMHTKNLQGTVLHVWPDSGRQTFFDEYRVRFSFQTGSLIPIYYQQEYQAPGGIANFYDFMQLVDAPKLTSDNPPRPNLVKIFYNSNVFPHITLIGMFDSNGITFADSSQNPNQVMGWGADFLVYESTPTLSANLIANLQRSQELLEIWKEENITRNPNLATINASANGVKATTRAEARDHLVASAVGQQLIEDVNG